MFVDCFICSWMDEGGTKKMMSRAYFTLCGISDFSCVKFACLVCQSSLMPIVNALRGF